MSVRLFLLICALGFARLFVMAEDVKRRYRRSAGWLKRTVSITQNYCLLNNNAVDHATRNGRRAAPFVVLVVAVIVLESGVHGWKQHMLERVMQ